MATINLSFDTGNISLAELNDALAAEWGYSAVLPNGKPNPLTKAQFCRQQIGRILREAFRNGKRKALLAQAEASVPDITII